MAGCNPTPPTPRPVRLCRTPSKAAVRQSPRHANSAEVLEVQLQSGWAGFYVAFAGVSFLSTGLEGGDLAQARHTTPAQAPPLASSRSLHNRLRTIKDRRRRSEARGVTAVGSDYRGVYLTTDQENRLMKKPNHSARFRPASAGGL